MRLDMQTARWIGAAALTLGCLAGLALALQPKAPSADAAMADTRAVPLRGMGTADTGARFNQAPIAQEQGSLTNSQPAVLPKQANAVPAPILTPPTTDQHQAQLGVASTTQTSPLVSQSVQSASTRAPAPAHWATQQAIPAAKSLPTPPQMAKETAQASNQLARAQEQATPKSTIPLVSANSQRTTPPFDQRQRVAQPNMPILGDRQAPKLSAPLTPAVPAAPALQSVSAPAQVAASTDETVVVKARRAIIASRTPIDAIGKGNSVTIRLPRRTGR
jgi:hypothetical protein